MRSSARSWRDNPNSVLSLEPAVLQGGGEAQRPSCIVSLSLDAKGVSISSHVAPASSLVLEGEVIGRQNRRSLSSAAPSLAFDGIKTLIQAEAQGSGNVCPRSHRANPAARPGFERVCLTSE